MLALSAELLSLKPESPVFHWYSVPCLPLEKWEAAIPLCRGCSWWPKRTPGKCSLGAITRKGLEAHASGFNTGYFKSSDEEEAFGQSRVSTDLRPLTPTLCYTTGKETEAQRKVVVCLRPHTWQEWGRRNLSKHRVAQANKSFHAAMEHPAFKILSNEQVMGHVHNPGPLAHTKGPRRQHWLSPLY